MDSEILYKSVIEPVQRALGINSGVHLMLGTAAAESGMGRWFKQVRGPALSPWQIETRTAYDIEYRYLPEKKPHLIPILEGLKLKDQAFFNVKHTSALPKENKELYGNLYYSCAIARLLYYSKPQPLPAHDDIWGLARYWKRHYNTRLGKGRAGQFVRAYRKYVRK